jgi:hypothetical protein
MAPRIVTARTDDGLIDTEPAISGPTYLHWSPIFAGAIVAAAVSFVLISFGSGIGLAVASPSSSWRDTSSVLALLGGLWLLLTSLAAFGLGGYLAGHLREILSAAPPDAVNFRDGIHGLLVWGLAIIMGRSYRSRPREWSSHERTWRPQPQRPPNLCWRSSLIGCFDRTVRRPSSATTPSCEPERRGSSQLPLGTREWSRPIATIWFVWSRLGLV